MDRLPKDLRKRFYKKIKRIIKSNKQRRHLKHNVPYFSDKVTSSARLIYELIGNKIIFYKCFKDHKVYEKWLKTFK